MQNKRHITLKVFFYNEQQVIIFLSVAYYTEHQNPQAAPLFFSIFSGSKGITSKQETLHTLGFCIGSNRPVYSYAGYSVY